MTMEKHRESFKREIPGLDLSKVKDLHIKICLEKVVESSIGPGFKRYRFIHQALPEIDWEEIDITVEVFGKKLSAPILISSITGGTPQAAEINSNLAKAAQALNIGMVVGSQRMALENPSLAPSYQVRDVAPRILLFGNLGAVHLNHGYGIEQCLQAIQMIQADGLTLYLNPLQESFQRKGSTNFKGLVEKITHIKQSVPFPIIAKEVGYGISEETAAKLKETGVDAIDVAGFGGTSWGRIEKFILEGDTYVPEEDPFDDWGIPTAESICNTKKGAPGATIIASGGIRNGVDGAKSIALGANLIGLGLPLLKAAVVSFDKVVDVLNKFIEELKIGMFCIGATNLKELARAKLITMEG